MLWGISLVVLLAGVATGVTTWLIAGSDDPSANEIRSNPKSGQPAVEQPSQTAPSQRATTAAVTPSQAPSTGSAAAAYRCWNGVEVERLRDCSRPHGVAGLAWVFPSFHPAGCRNMKDYEAVVSRVVFFECQEVTPRGSAITLHYSIWRTSSAGYAHYDGGVGAHRTTGYSPSGKVVGFKWLSITGAGEFKAAVMYARAPFTVSLYAPSSAARADAIRDVLQIRPPVEIRGLPAHKSSP